MLVQTSKDLLFIVIAFCILWITVFFCWLLYYFIMTTKRLHDVVRGAKEKIDRVGEILELLKKKVETGASYVGALVEAATKVTDYLKTKNSRRTKSAKKMVEKIKDQK